MFVDSTKKFLETARNDPNKYKKDRNPRTGTGIKIEDISERRTNDESCC